MSSEPTKYTDLELKLRDLHISLGKIKMQHALLQWAITHKSALDHLGLCPSFIKACADEVQKSEPL